MVMARSSIGRESGRHFRILTCMTNQPRQRIPSFVASVIEPGGREVAGERERGERERLRKKGNNERTREKQIGQMFRI